jgi:hypothetical protein
MPKLRKRSGRATPQSLVHATAVQTVGSSTTTTTVSANGLNVVETRPARPHKLSVQYFSPLPRSFNFVVLAANGEEIYRSPAILSGPIPKTFTATMPPNTDFGFYASAIQPVIQFAHTGVTSGSISWVINLHVAYKYPQLASLF